MATTEQELADADAIVAEMSPLILKALLSALKEGLTPETASVLLARAIVYGIHGIDRDPTDPTKIG
jgi:hypothetical protein